MKRLLEGDGKQRLDGELLFHPVPLGIHQVRLTLRTPHSPQEEAVHLEAVAVLVVAEVGNESSAI